MIKEIHKETNAPVKIAKNMFEIIGSFSANKKYGTSEEIKIINSQIQDFL